MRLGLNPNPNHEFRREAEITELKRQNLYPITEKKTFKKSYVNYHLRSNKELFWARDHC